MARILGVDYGEARTGLALSDISETLAGGIGMVEAAGIREAVSKTARIALEHGAVRAVVGLPLNMDGSEGERARRCRKFGALLARAARIKVSFWDERQTTLQAHGYLDSTGASDRKRREVVDTLSAQIILQGWLDRRKAEADGREQI